MCENRLFVCFNFVAVFHSIFALIHYFILPASQPNKLLILFLTHTYTFKYIHIHAHTGTRTSNESCQLAKFKNSHEVRRKQRRVCVYVCVRALICVPLYVCVCVFVRNRQKFVIAIKFRCFTFALLLLACCCRLFL